jgi:hypothetical protein
MKTGDPTQAADAAAEEARIEAEMERLSEKCEMARASIVVHLGGKWKRGTPESRSSIPCPCCELGVLHYRRSGYNGHIQAKCTTPRCVDFIE